MIPVILPLYERADLVFSHGEGVYLYTTDGKKYLDFAAGYAVMALGHCNPKLVEVLCTQAGKLWHTSNRYKIPGMEEYARKLVDISFGDTVFFANSGAEVVECMIKMARRYFDARDERHRYRIITMEGAFHGRTLAAATAGAKEKMEGFGPPVEGFDRVAWNDLAALQSAVTSATAAVMVEPIQGEGGMRALSYEYMRGLRDICDRYGLLLLLDEVQSGMGRSGHMFAYEMFDIKPDIMALGKGLGAGFPLSACIATEKVGKEMRLGSHGSTYGGNPLAMAIGNTVLDIISDPAFLARIRAVGAYLKEMLFQLRNDHRDKIEDITGAGLMLGIRLKPGINVDKFTKICRDMGLLSIPAAMNTLRITPPLIITERDCDEAIEKLSRALKVTDGLLYKIKQGFGNIKDRFTKNTNLSLFIILNTATILALKTMAIGGFS